MFLIKSPEFRLLYVHMWRSILRCQRPIYEPLGHPDDADAWAAGRRMDRAVSINYSVYKDDMLAVNT